MRRGSAGITLGREPDVKLSAGFPFLPMVLAACLAPAGAQAASPPGLQWVAEVTPDRSTNYPVNSVYRLGDGSVLVVESQFFAGVAATDLAADGTVLSTHELPLPDIYDGSLRVSVDAFGAVFVGLTATPRPLEAWVMKFDGLTGRALWPGPFHYRFDSVTDTLFRSLAVDARGNLFVTGLSATQTGVTFIYSLDGATGGILWGPVSHIDPVTPGLTFLNVAANANGDAIVSGSWENDAGTLGQIAAFKFDGRTGVPLWGPVLVPAGSAGPDSVRFAALDPHGDLVVVGDRTEGQTYRAVVLKIDGKIGSVLWGPLAIGGIQTAFPPSNLLRLDALGDVLLGAWSPDLTGSSTLGAPVLLKLSGQDGSVLWGPIPYPGDSSAYAYPIAAALEPGGDFVVAFSERKTSPLSYAALTVRIDGATGTVLWGPIFLATAGVSGGLLPDSGEGILLAVTTINPQNSNVVSQPEVVFYSGATGAIVRGPLELPVSARSGRAVRVAVDAAGDVVTLGQVSRDGPDWTVLVKYRGSTGEILWGPVELPSDAWGSPVDLKLATNGDPIWIGTGESPAFGTGGVVLSRFSGSTGAVVWGPRVFTQAYGAALALDGNGDVFALGTTVLLKCDGLTGGLLWGPVSTPNPGASALRIGPTGDITVAGWYSGAAVGKYRGTTGAPVWGPITIAAASYPQAMEIDASGDFVRRGQPRHTACTPVRGCPFRHLRKGALRHEAYERRLRPRRPPRRPGLCRGTSPREGRLRPARHADRRRARLGEVHAHRRRDAQRAGPEDDRRREGERPEGRHDPPRALPLFQFGLGRPPRADPHGVPRRARRRRRRRGPHGDDGQEPDGRHDQLPDEDQDRELARREEAPRDGELPQVARSPSFPYDPRLRSAGPRGEVLEWLIRTVSKTVLPERVTWVRIPPSPPSDQTRPSSSGAKRRSRSSSSSRNASSVSPESAMRARRQKSRTCPAIRASA